MNKDRSWNTALVDTGPNRLMLRGRPIADFLRNASFAETLLVLWTGRAPREWEIRLIDMALIAAIDHGPRSPAANVARIAASTGNDPLDAAALGLMATGPYHGAAVTACAHLLSSSPEGSPKVWASEVVASYRSRGERIPGVGHRSHTEDPRTVVIFGAMKSFDVGKRYIAAVQALADEVSGLTGKPICVNVDGALAVVTLTVGLDPEYGNALFGVSRSAGLAAHAVEERTRERPMRHIDTSAARYDGPATTD